jgi:hypothetical protein
MKILSEEEKRLRGEARRATKFLKGKTVERIRRYRSHEVVIQFTDGWVFFIDSESEPLDMSYHETRIEEDQ